MTTLSSAITVSPVEMTTSTSKFGTIRGSQSDDTANDVLCRLLPGRPVGGMVAHDEGRRAADIGGLLKLVV